jgi:hypothetical protein
VNLTYVLHDAGWATAVIADGDRRREMVVSYLSDSLAEMTQSALTLLEGAETARFSFDDEPGEHRFVVTRSSPEFVDIRVLWFDDLWTGLPDERGSEVFVCSCSVARFAGEVLSCLQHLLSEHGLNGYKQKWVAHDFPSDIFDALQAKVHERKRQKATA